MKDFRYQDNFFCDDRRTKVPWLLIVDDNEMFRNVFRTSLMQRIENIDIHEAGSAENAMAKISDSPPFLIFMDIQLPGENGLQLTRKIKHLYPQILVVVCTSFDSNDYRQAAYRAGADYFFSKSAINIKKLIRLIHSHMEKE